MARVDTLKCHLRPMDRKTNHVHAATATSEEFPLVAALLIFAPSVR